MSEIYKLNKHDATCGMLEPLTNQLKSYQNNQFKDDFQFLANLYEDFHNVDSFLTISKHFKQGIFFYNAYDGLQGLNNSNGYRILPKNNTLHYLDFNIAKHLRRMESHIEMGNNCSHCEKVINLNLYEYKHCTRKVKDREKLKNLDYQIFKNLITTIDFLIGIVSAKPIIPMKRFCFNNQKEEIWK